MVYAWAALTALNKSQRRRPEIIQNHCLCNARKRVNFTCISDDELRSRFNIANIKQRILALERNW